jgi:hypothetical protein
LEGVRQVLNVSLNVRSHVIHFPLELADPQYKAEGGKIQHNKDKQIEAGDCSERLRERGPNR